MLAGYLLVGHGDDTKTIIVEVGGQLKHTLADAFIQRLDHVPIFNLDADRQDFLHGPLTD